MLGHSYTASKHVAQVKMGRAGVRRIVVFSMGKTGSTAIARTVAEATGAHVFQVFRLDASRLADAEARYRLLHRDARRRGRDASRAPFPGAAHLWESEFLLRHPPTPQAPWEVITTVREPVAQSVSAFFHGARRRGSLEGDPPVAALTATLLEQRWLRRPLRWFEREFAPALGIDVYDHPFDPSIGSSIIETAAVRVLLLRQESFDVAPTALAEFLSLPRAVSVASRNEAASKEYAAAYRAFLERVAFPDDVLAATYAAPYSRHFYSDAERADFVARWGSDARSRP